LYYVQNNSYWQCNSTTHFQIEMQDLLTMHKFYSLAYLPHENGAAAFRQYEIVVYYSLKEFAAVDP